MTTSSGGIVCNYPGRPKVIRSSSVSALDNPVIQMREINLNFPENDDHNNNYDNMSIIRNNYRKFSQLFVGNNESQKDEQKEADVLESNRGLSFKRLFGLSRRPSISKVEDEDDQEDEDDLYENTNDNDTPNKSDDTDSGGPKAGRRMSRMISVQERSGNIEEYDVIGDLRSGQFIGHESFYLSR